MKNTILIIMLMTSVSILAKKRKSKVIYKYKKFESFDFENISVEGDSSTPGDISVNPRFRVRFKNKLPEKKSFNTEVIDSIDMIQ